MGLKRRHADENPESEAETGRLASKSGKLTLPTREDV